MMKKEAIAKKIFIAFKKKTGNELTNQTCRSTFLNDGQTLVIFQLIIIIWKTIEKVNKCNGWVHLFE